MVANTPTDRSVGSITTTMVKQNTKVKVLQNLDTLLHIFNHLPLNDCFTCRLVCRNWHHAVDKHFRTLSRLNIVYKDVTQMSAESYWRSSGEARRDLCFTIEVHSILHYDQFAQTLSRFPSAQHFSLTHHPVNDIFLSLLVVFLSKLRHIHLQSCWMHPSVLHERLNRSNSSLVDPLWTLLDKLYTSRKYPAKDKSTIDYLIETIRQICPDEASCDHLCSFLNNVAHQNDSALADNVQVGHRTIDLSTQSQLSKMGYRLLSKSFHRMTSLTLSNCGLTEETAQIVLKELTQLKHLNIVDNENIEGDCLQYLAPTCTSLIVGSFNLRVSVLELLNGIVRSGAVSALTHLELTGFIGTSLHHLEGLVQLEHLVLHFYCDRSEAHFLPFFSITRLSRLRSLVLQQEYCYEETSALEHGLFCSITQHCHQLQRLEVLGEYGWKLQLTDQSLLALTANAPKLRQLSLTGNSIHITDKGIEHLAQLTELEQLSLTSFDGITDKSISYIVGKLYHLSSLCLLENSQLTNKTLETCVEEAFANPERRFSVHIDEKQLSSSKLLMNYASNYLRHTWHRQIDPFVTDPMHPDEQTELSTQLNRATIVGTDQNRNDQHDTTHQRWPTNLNVVIDENLRCYKYDAEDLTLVKLITILFASILIIAMMVTTLAVVVLLPSAMALYLLYEKIFASFSLLALTR